MLFGSYRHNIDKKGRVAIPAKYRDELGEHFMLCKGIYGKRCLGVYSPDQWDRLVEKISQLPSAKSSVVKRFLYAGTFEVELDTQGRILIPASLRDYAELSSEAFFIGMGSNLEIWNSDKWQAENAECTPESIASIVEGLDF